MYQMILVCTLVINGLALNAALMMMARAAMSLAEHSVCRRWSARRRADFYFLVQVTPPMLALLLTALVFLPAYLKYEPTQSHEIASVKLSLFAGFALSVIVMAAARIWLDHWRAQRFLRAWQESEDLDFTSLPFPAKKLSHQYPICCLVGCWSPRLFVADSVVAKLEREELQAMLLHETGHYCSRDNLKQILMRFASTLLFFLPGASTPYRRWQREQEKACDDYAREQTSAPLELASALVKIGKLLPAGTRLSTFLTPGLSFHRFNHESLLIERIERLIEPSTSVPDASISPLLTSRAACRLAALAVVAIVAVILAAPQPLRLYHDAIEMVVRLLS
jgi:Zn-dependent protease with chaperone function